MLDSFWFYPDFVWNHLPLKMKKFHTKYLASWRYVFISWSMVSLFTNILVRSTSQTKKIKFSWTFETQLRQRFLTLCGRHPVFFFLQNHRLLLFQLLSYGHIYKTKQIFFKFFCRFLSTILIFVYISSFDDRLSLGFGLSSSVQSESERIKTDLSQHSLPSQSIRPCSHRHFNTSLLSPFAGH